ncbi:hypothetical protein VSP20_02600 [Myroides phaeus]|uniref:hypothetical protein n=1 Tax=Myroides phaeus TaxID=702745 RepID=UPI002DB95423|nr:hypothetical protein [Myroides phaeus]MEC4115849.1 hypothetical protein [Myroides phaeus]
MKNIYRIIQLLMLCLVCNMSYAQNNKLLGTKISDKSEVQPSNLKSNSILELESKAKGFLLPRMTTAERNQINVNESNSSDTGLAIFNIDNDCVEYYTAISKKWVSLCGTLPPAKIEFNGECSQLLITKPGDFRFVAGDPITGRNVQVTVPIKINEAGTYQVDVYSRKDGKSNGYYFSTTGTFLSKGTIEVAIIGQGTPLDGYDDVNQGDTFVVNLNGVEVLTCSSKQHVEKAATKYKIVENTYFVKGPLYLGVPAIATNTVDIEVDVEGVGKYTIESIGEGVNGISLFGSGEFTKTGSNTVTLRASGIPTGSGIQGEGGFNIPIKTNSGLVGSVPTNTKVIAKVTPTKLTPQCTNITAVGKYIKGSAIDLKDNLLRVPVKVVAPGKTSLKMVSTDGFVFKSDEQSFTFDADKDNITEVVLRPESKVIPFTLNSTEFAFEANPALELTGCTPFKIDFEQPAVDYEIVDCKVVPRSKNFPVAKPLPVEKFGIDVNVKVKIAGPYTIATTDLSNSGVSFTASGVFKVEEQGKEVQVTLVPSGEFKGDPNVSTPYNYSIYKNIEHSDVCNFKINAGLRSIGILDLGTYKAGLSTVFGPNFYGEEGKYAKVLEVNYFDKTFKELLESKSNEEAKIALEKFIVDNEIDIVLLQFEGSETWATISGNKNVVMDVLVDFVKARKITMIYYGQALDGKEQSNPKLENMINYIGHKFYPNDSQAPKWTTKPYVAGQSSGRDQFFNKFASESNHRYLNPKAFMSEKLMPKEKIDPKGKTYIMSRGSFSFLTPVSDNFIILTERTYFESKGTRQRGYTGYTLKDYPVVVLNGIKEYGSSTKVGEEVVK